MHDSAAALLTETLGPGADAWSLGDGEVLEAYSLGTTICFCGSSSQKLPIVLSP